MSSSLVTFLLVLHTVSWLREVDSNFLMTEDAEMEVSSTPDSTEVAVVLRSVVEERVALLLNSPVLSDPISDISETMDWLRLMVCLEVLVFCSLTLSLMVVSTVVFSATSFSLSLALSFSNSLELVLFFRAVFLLREPLLVLILLLLLEALLLLLSVASMLRLLVLLCISSRAVSMRARSGLGGTGGGSFFCPTLLFALAPVFALAFLDKSFLTVFEGTGFLRLSDRLTGALVTAGLLAPTRMEEVLLTEGRLGSFSIGLRVVRGPVTDRDFFSESAEESRALRPPGDTDRSTGLRGTVTD